MTVPEGTPKNVEWADRMRQALQIAGSNLGSLEEIFRPNRLAGGEAFNGLKNALSKLDVIADELSAFDMPQHSCSGRACVHGREPVLVGPDWLEATFGKEIKEKGLCTECGHEQHGFDVQEFSVICGYKTQTSAVQGTCQCRGM